MGTNVPHIYAVGDCVETYHRLAEAQIFGHRAAEVSKRVDVFAAALFNELTVDALSDVDLSYTSPLSTPWDPVQVAAQAWITNWIRG